LEFWNNGKIRLDDANKNGTPPYFKKPTFHYSMIAATAQGF
jgi:hypothetical protein